MIEGIALGISSNIWEENLALVTPLINLIVFSNLVIDIMGYTKASYQNVLSLPTYESH
jgi:hypothetical protein